MRLRIETTPPLPPRKTYLSVSAGLFGLGTRTINDLRKRLISELGLPQGIQLQLNDFDLHGKDTIEGLLEKDDLVKVILREEGGLKAGEESKDATAVETKSVTLGKRKRSQEDISEDSSSESSSESESESKEEDEEESEEESEDSEESEESSETESDSESSDSDRPSKVSKLRPQLRKTSSSSSSSSTSSESTSSSSSNDSVPNSAKQTLTSPPVPPGKGSERTHLRNQRKTRIKQLKRFIANGTLPQGSTLQDLDTYQNNTPLNPSTPSYVQRPQAIVPDNQHTTFNQEDETSPSSETERIRAPKRVDLAAASRFIKAGLVGNEGYDRAREEVRARASEKILERKKETSTQLFLPRKVVVKTPHVESVEAMDVDESTELMQDYIPDTPLNGDKDSLIDGFFEQVDLATRHRKKISSPQDFRENHITGYNSTDIVVRAFECEPEWLGMVEAEEDEQVDPMEIYPPHLPFNDANDRRQRRQATVNEEPFIPPSNNRPAEEVFEEISLEDILTLPILETPVVGADIYFKSMFLHPVLLEPVVLWRWGRIVEVDGDEVTINIVGPRFRKEDEEEVNGTERNKTMSYTTEEEEEEGTPEETLLWENITDARYLVRH